VYGITGSDLSVRRATPFVRNKAILSVGTFEKAKKNFKWVMPKISMLKVQLKEKSRLR
jgi:hypothetical protein